MRQALPTVDLSLNHSLLLPQLGLPLSELVTRRYETCTVTDGHPSIQVAHGLLTCSFGSFFLNRGMTRCSIRSAPLLGPAHLVHPHICSLTDDRSNLASD